MKLYITVFIGGVVSLALELAASRLLAPAFGTAELVWSAIIGLILLYMAVGYAIGGRWADRSPYPGSLYTVLVIAGLTIATIPLLARPMLRMATQGMLAWNLGLIAGPFLFILVLFVAPVTLLACVSPFAIRLSATQVTESGVTSGRIYAVSTLGSFIGTFLPNLVLIPTLGTRRTFLVLALLTTTTGLWGLWLTQRRRFWVWCWTLPLLIALLFIPVGSVKPQEGLVYEQESTYNFIQVVETSDKVRLLYLNEGQGIHSVLMPGEEILTGGPWDYYLIAPYFNPAPYAPENVESLLVIGLAAGTTPSQYTQVYGPIPMDGVEIDPAIVQAGRDYFEMTQPNLTVHIGDGRTYLTQTHNRYTVVAVDAYRLPYIPWHLATVEFFEQVREHLNEDGVLAINVGHTDDDWRLVAAMVATLRQVFPSTHVIAVPDSLNAIVVATMRPTSAGNLSENLPLLADERLRTVAQSAIQNQRAIKPGDLIFRDDRAPIEALTNDLALRYVLGIQ